MPDYVTDALVGTRIRFQSKNDKDSVSWRGIVIGVGKYALARAYGNHVPYHEAVKKNDPDVGALEDLTFFIIQLDDSPIDGITTRAFANDWILPGSFEAIDERVRVVVEIYDLPTNNHNNIRTVLEAAGYKAIIKSIG